MKTEQKSIIIQKILLKLEKLDMGLNLFSSSTNWINNEKQAVDPNPSAFIVEDTKYVNGCTIALVKYSGCTNYQGQKLLFWTKIVKPEKWTRVDPHFQENSIYSPFARFEPTSNGLKAAVVLANNIRK